MVTMRVQAEHRGGSNNPVVADRPAPPRRRAGAAASAPSERQHGHRQLTVAADRVAPPRRRDEAADAALPERLEHRDDGDRPATADTPPQRRRGDLAAAAGVSERPRHLDSTNRPASADRQAPLRRQNLAEAAASSREQHGSSMPLPSNSSAGASKAQVSCCADAYLSFAGHMRSGSTVTCQCWKSPQAEQRGGSNKPAAADRVAPPRSRDRAAAGASSEQQYGTVMPAERTSPSRASEAQVSQKLTLCRSAPFVWERHAQRKQSTAGVKWLCRQCKEQAATSQQPLAGW